MVIDPREGNDNAQGPKGAVITFSYLEGQYHFVMDTEDFTLFITWTSLLSIQKYLWPLLPGNIISDIARQ